MKRLGQELQGSGKSYDARSLAEAVTRGTEEAEVYAIQTPYREINKGAVEEVLRLAGVTSAAGLRTALAEEIMSRIQNSTVREGADGKLYIWGSIPYSNRDHELDYYDAIVGIDLGS